VGRKGFNNSDTAFEVLYPTSKCNFQSSTQVKVMSSSPPAIDISSPSHVRQLMMNPSCLSCLQFLRSIKRTTLLVNILLEKSDLTCAITVPSSGLETMDKSNFYPSCPAASRLEWASSVAWRLESKVLETVSASTILPSAFLHHHVLTRKNKRDATNRLVLQTMRDHGIRLQASCPCPPHALRPRPPSLLFHWTFSPLLEPSSSS